ncbi:hypothetical protein [Microcella indica]|uniref:hypothetical protein n=1 Tax=Microcella indica TaxID=2750620 RepID=UPI0015CEFDC4|nr:hypothetical protein [Microcella indica]
MLRSLFSGAAIAAVIIVAIPAIPAAVTAVPSMEPGGAPSASLIEAVEPASVPTPTPSPTVMDADATDEPAAAPSTEDVAKDEPHEDATDGAGAAPAPEPERTSSGGATSAASAPAPANRTVTEESDVVYRALPAPLPTELATPACPAPISGSTAGAPSATSELGVAGTTSEDLASFATRYNQIRVANCLPPVPFGNIRYDSCMEQRLFWMAEDPSTDPMSAWGHIGSQRSDGVPSVGCDGNLAGGSGNTGATVADKWWASSGHRASLYKPGNTGSMAGTCILFAMTHGGVPNEPYSFTRAAARWVSC